MAPGQRVPGVPVDVDELADEAARAIKIAEKRNPYLIDIEAADRKKTEEHFDSPCKCAAPYAKPEEEGKYKCAKCGHGLNVDTAGQPYRRLPGDLDNSTAAKLTRALGEKAEELNKQMLELVRSLPHAVQVRLARMPDKQFKKEALKLIRKHQAIRQFDESGQGLTKNARRRMAVRLEQARQTIVAEQEYCKLCGLLKDKRDHDGHGLGECVAICKQCGGSGESLEKILETGDDPCDRCQGSGADPCTECFGTGDQIPGNSDGQCEQCHGTKHQPAGLATIQVDGHGEPVAREMRPLEETEASRLLTHPEHDRQDRMDRAPAEDI